MNDWRQCPHLHDGRCAAAESLVQLHAGVVADVATHERDCLLCVTSGGWEQQPNRATAGLAITAVESHQREAVRSAIGKYTVAVIASHPGPGVGGRLWDVLQRLGAPHCTACLLLAQRMNAWGPDGCREHRAEILAEMLSRAGSWKLTRHAPRFLKRPALALLVDWAISGSDEQPPLSGAATAAQGVRQTRPPRPRPVRPPPVSRGKSAEPAERRPDELSVSVVVTCHDYGRFLAQCLDSIIAQTRPADEVLVVDDASDDDTPAVAASYADRGVRYLRVEHRNVTLAKRDSLYRTTGDVLCFLDADDWLAEDYLAGGMPLFADTYVGVVYSDCQRFGDRTDRSHYPATVGADDLAVRNYCHTASLTRRDAILISRAFDSPPPAGMPEDYHRFKLLARHGWRFVKQPSFIHYRAHSASVSAREGRPGPYYRFAGLERETVTIVVPLSGRHQFWPRLADWFATQTWPAEQVALLLYDTSQDDDFGRTVRSWSAAAPFRDVRYVRRTVSRPGLADELRVGNREVQREVNETMARIYGEVSRLVATDYTLIVEDDILPPADAIDRLLHGMGQRVACVSGAYQGRHRDFDRTSGQENPPIWLAWQATGPGFTDPGRNVLERGRGVRDVGGTGFGCLLVRMALLRSHVFWTPAGTHWFDPAFMRSVRRDGWRVLIDWDCLCQHG